MGDGTGISWTDATWNPVRGCSRVSEGCRNCYAERVAARFSGPGQPYEGLATMKPGKPAAMHRIDKKVAGLPRWTGEVRLIPEHLADPLRWKKPRRIFVNSMSDLFHEKLTNEQIAAVFGVMAACPQHTFQILTKRATRMREWFEWIGKRIAVDARNSYVYALVEADEEFARHGYKIFEGPRGDITRAGRLPMSWPLPNVWLGVSVENQEAADERIPELLETQAAIRFLSCEPLLGAVEIAQYFDPCSVPCGEEPWPELDWVIAGCESGPGARECKVEWLRSLRDQCAAAGVPYFLKQAKFDADVDGNGVRDGAGSKFKSARNSSPSGNANRLLELPYLDGEQHAAFPEVA